MLTIGASPSPRLPGASVGANRPPTTLSRQTRSWRAFSASILCVQRTRAAAKPREFLENFWQLFAIFTRSDGIPDKIWVRPPKAAENPDKNGPRLAGESGHWPSGFRLTYIGIFGGPVATDQQRGVSEYVVNTVCLGFEVQLALGWRCYRAGSSSGSSVSPRLLIMCAGARAVEPARCTSVWPGC